MPTNTPEETLTTGQAAKELRVTYVYVGNLIRAGEIKADRLTTKGRSHYRITRQELNEYKRRIAQNGK